VYLDEVTSLSDAWHLDYDVTYFKWGGNIDDR